MNKDLELVLEQCKGVIDREIPLLVLAPEYTKILLDYIEKIQQENELLKERVEYLKRSNDRREETIISLRDEIIELEEKIKETINNINVTISIIKQRPSKDEGLDFYIISKLESFVKTLKEKKND